MNASSKGSAVMFYVQKFMDSISFIAQHWLKQYLFVPTCSCNTIHIIVHVYSYGIGEKVKINLNNYSSVRLCES